MNISIEKFLLDDAQSVIKIWNEVVENGIAFPQENKLNLEDGINFFSSQTYCGVAKNENNTIVGLYILHPNNVGRCSHIANASYAVAHNLRGQHIGEKLVSDSLMKAKKFGFKILQFNAVVKTNTSARHLYEKLGFIQLGTIPNGFRINDTTFEDICPYYHIL